MGLDFAVYPGEMRWDELGGDLEVAGGSVPEEFHFLGEELDLWEEFLLEGLLEEAADVGAFEEVGYGEVEDIVMAEHLPTVLFVDHLQRVHPGIQHNHHIDEVIGTLHNPPQKHIGLFLHFPLNLMLQIMRKHPIERQQEPLLQLPLGYLLPLKEPLPRIIEFLELTKLGFIDDTHLHHH